MTPFAAELLGTCLVVLLGNGVVANVVLARTKGHGAGWIVITIGWAMAVFVGVFCSASASGAHLNPAVTVAMVAAGKLPVALVPVYIGAQLLGAMLGACGVYLFYRDHFAVTDDADGKLACFCTGPAIRRVSSAFLCEVIGTLALVLPVFLMTSVTVPVPGGGVAPTEVTVGLGTLGALPVALVVLAIGLSLGGTTGYAINPARDVGPRLMHAILPIPGKRDCDWSYAWVPVVGPLVGGLVAAGVYLLLR
jgi:glycerol uptake facilitator protein